MIKIKIGGGDGAGLDDRSLALLAEDFAPLDSLADKLASRVMRFLAEGSGGKVLDELAALKQAGQILRLRSAGAPAPEESASARNRFFESAACASPAFFARLGKVYEAASRPLRFRMARVFGDPALDWLQVLLIEATELTLDTWPRHCRPCALLTADLIEAMLEAEGHPRDLLARAAFLPPGAARSRFGLEMEPVWESLAGLGASAGRHPAAALAALSQFGFKQQLRALNLLEKSHAPPAAFPGKLFELANARSEKVRARAGRLLAAALPQAGAFLREKAIRGGSGERARAARLLWRAEGGDAPAFLAARIPREKSRKVARVLRELAASMPPGACATPDVVSGRAAARPHQEETPGPCAAQNGASALCADSGPCATPNTV
jgi:hypothetical protein